MRMKDRKIITIKIDDLKALKEHVRKCLKLIEKLEVM